MITVRLRGFEEATEYFQAQQWTKEIEDEGEKVLEKWARDLCNYTKNNHSWKSRTGRLEASHKFSRVGRLHWQVSADTRMGGGDKNYAIFLEIGTMPHTITGNPTLAWSDKGGLHFAHSVKHPGIGGGRYAWFGPAVELHRKIIFNDMKDSIKKVILTVKPIG